MSREFKIELPESLPRTDGVLGDRHLQIQLLLEEVAEWPEVQERLPNAAEILAVLGPTLGRLVFLVDRVLSGDYPTDNDALTDAAVFEVFKKDIANIAAARKFFAEPEEGQA